ncbi:hypothetical protein BJI49_05285 [Acetobacter pasteurianus]|nr:hypothetical protein BJI49_05285 [Acetobacter pasteurianus]
MQTRPTGHACLALWHIKHEHDRKSPITPANSDLDIRTSESKKRTEATEPPDYLVQTPAPWRQQNP